MGVTLTVLHPGEGQQQAIAVFFFVGQFQVQQLVTAVNSPPFDDLIAGKDAVDDMYVRIGRTYLNGDRLAVVGELRGRLPEPIVGLRSGTLIVEGEYHKLTLDGVALADSLKGMLTRIYR